MNPMKESSTNILASLPAALLRQAWIFLDEGRAGDAQVSASAVLKSLAASEDELRFECHLILLRARQVQQESELAIEHGLTLVALAERLDRNSLRSTAHSDLAAVYGAAGLHDLAVTHLQESLRHARARSSHQLSTPFYRLGSVYLELGRAKEALSCLESARKGYLFLQQEDGVISALIGEGRALLQMERTSEALRHLQWARTLIEKSQAPEELPAAYRWLGEAHAQAGDHEAAHASFESAINLHQQGIGVELEADNRLAYAEYQLACGDLFPALDNLEIALELFRAGRREEQEARVLRLLGDVLEQTGDVPRAFAVLKEYVALRNKLDAQRGQHRATVQIIQLEQSLRRTSSPPYLTNQVLAKENRFLREQAQRLDRLSNIDHLTGLHNRRYLLQRFKSKLGDGKQGLSGSLVLLDIDDFKQINDTFSHVTGDAVLVELSGIFMKEFRSWDVVSRWGGEEFVVLMPGATLEEAAAVTDAVRVAVQEHDWHSLIGDHRLTISIGVTAFDSEDSGSLQEVMDAASLNLKKAKQTGKNRIVAGS
jgi:diguanylate cyclase (GGDEF)-like protein